MADFYCSIKKYEQASYFMNKIDSMMQRNKALPTTVSAVNKLAFKVDSGLGKYLSAIDHMERYNQIHDSVFTATNSKQLSELNIKYETGQKEKDIALLKSQRATQEAKLQQANLQRNITIGGVAMLLIIAGVAYNGYRNKQRSNIQLQLKQTEINKQNSELQKLVVEKDWLLKEVHHRVKNNLQIVMSLLSTQSAYLQNSDALDAIRESQNRVQSIALIHQKLYSGTNVASIDMPSYVTDLVNYLADGFDTHKRGIRFEQLIEPIKMDLAQAVPLGLILNEAITNAVKYAFEKGGEVIIGLQLIAQDSVILTVTDNGMGLPADFDIRTTNSLGMEMMKALSKQLGGSFEIKSKSGTSITIEFQLERALIGYQSKILILD